MAGSTLMTLTEYARHKGVDLAAVKRAISDGRLGPDAIKLGSNKRKLVIVKVADAQWARNTLINNMNEGRQANMVMPGDEPDADEDDSPPESGGPSKPAANTSLMQYRTVKEGLTAKMLQLQYEEKLGNLCSADDVKKAAKEIGMNIRNALLNVPDKLAPLVAAESNIDKVQKILTDEIHIVLTNLSRGDYDFLKGAAE